MAVEGLVDAVVDMGPLDNVHELNRIRIGVVIELAQAAQQEHFALLLHEFDLFHGIRDVGLAAQHAEHQPDGDDHVLDIGNHALGRKPDAGELIDPDAVRYGLDMVEDGFLGGVDLVDVLTVDRRDEGGRELLGNVPVEHIALGFEAVDHLAAYIRIFEFLGDRVQQGGRLDDDAILFAKVIEEPDLTDRKIWVISEKG